MTSEPNTSAAGLIKRVNDVLRRGKKWVIGDGETLALLKECRDALAAEKAAAPSGEAEARQTPTEHTHWFEGGPIDASKILARGVDGALPFFFETLHHRDDNRLLALRIYAEPRQTLVREALARALCVEASADPDCLDEANCAFWKQWLPSADAAIRIFREAALTPPQSPSASDLHALTYDQLFRAISAATEPAAGNAVGVSVARFKAALPATPQSPAGLSSDDRARLAVLRKKDEDAAYYGRSSEPGATIYAWAADKIEALATALDGTETNERFAIREANRLRTALDAREQAVAEAREGAAKRLGSYLEGRMQEARRAYPDEMSGAIWDVLEDSVFRDEVLDAVLGDRA